MANRGPTFDKHVSCIQDLKVLASDKLPIMYRDYYNEGAMDLITLKDNEAAYDRYKIRPRILRNVHNIDTSTSIFGVKTSLPFGFSPTAMHKLAHPDGELATSRAAAKFGLCMGLSSYSTTSLEEVGEQGLGNPYAIQMCVLKDRSLTLQLLQRAEKAGYKALLLSVDVPVLGKRLNEYRNAFELPEDMWLPNIVCKLSDEQDSERSEGISYDPTLDWESAIPWLRKHTSLKIWLKGINAPEDVQLAIDHGVDGVIVSNHGGRQLDGAPATLDALRDCAPVAKGKIPIAMDGGVRRGSDIFKALALGAQYVFLGRVAIWGLAYNGQAGVELAIQILVEELKTTMALAGCRTIADINESYLSVLNPDGRLAKL